MSFAAIQTVRTTILSSALLHTEAYVGQMANFDANLSQGGAGALHFHDHQSLITALITCACARGSCRRRHPNDREPHRERRRLCPGSLMPSSL